MQSDFSEPKTSADRRRILSSLGLDRYLKKRNCIDLGELPVHCELYLSQPEDPVILFIPGIGTYSEIYTEFLCRFSALGYNMVSVDLRGHGRSGGPRGDYTVEEVVDDLALVLDYLDEHLPGPLIVFGCSIGARLGLALAEIENRVDALICHTLFLSECPPDFFHSLGWNWISFNAIWMPQFKTDFRHFIDINDLLEHNPMGQHAAKDDLMVWEYPLRTLNSVYSHKSRIIKESLNIPALIMVGEKDDVIRPGYLRSLIDSSAQHFDMIEIPNAAHMLPFDHIEETIKASSDWLKRFDLD